MAAAGAQAGRDTAALRARIDARYAILAARWAGGAEALDIGEVPDDHGGPHLELTAPDRIALVHTERGHETERLETRDIDELMYWLFRAQAKGRAIAEELENRRADAPRDTRRIWFPRALYLIGQIRAEWRDRLAGEFDAILRAHPYLD